MAEGPAIKNSPSVDLNEINLRSKTAAEDLLVHADLPSERPANASKKIDQGYRLQQTVRTPSFLDSGFEQEQEIKTSSSVGVAPGADQDFKTFSVSRGTGTVFDEIITGIAIALRALQEKIISFLSRGDEIELPKSGKNAKGQLTEEQELDDERAIRAHTLEEAMFMSSSSRQRRKFRRRMRLRK